MLHFARSTSMIGAPLTIVALLACVTPAGALGGINGTSLNGTSLNMGGLNGLALTGISTNARTPVRPALSDLNGVAVEAVIIPDAALR